MLSLYLAFSVIVHSLQKAKEEKHITGHIRPSSGQDICMFQLRNKFEGL
jgi:hypothetical protein